LSDRDDRLRQRALGGAGDQAGRLRADLWIVPADATFPAEGTTVVDENMVKAVPQVALKEKAHKHKKAPKAD
jgi:hypothetical protein